MNQDNKPDNRKMNSMGKVDRDKRNGRAHPAQEFIDSEKNIPGSRTEAPATAQQGRQPKVKEGMPQK